MQESAVSEVLGAVLLVSIVITGISIIGGLLMSAPSSDASPKLSLLVSCCQADATTYNVIISHQGGSPIKWSDMMINDSVLGELPSTCPTYMYTGSITSYNETGNGIVWDTDNKTAIFQNGQTLRIELNNPNPLPSRIMVFENILSKKILTDVTITCSGC